MARDHQGPTTPRNSDLGRKFTCRNWKNTASPGTLSACRSMTREAAVAKRRVQADEHTKETKGVVAAPVAERRASTADRRKTTLKTFLQGGLVPRRRTGRRADDHRLPVDWHDPQLLFLAVVMLLLSVTDAFLTVRLLAAGGTETNPLLALVLNEHPALFAAVKMGLTGFSVVVLVAVARSRLLGLISAQWLFQGLVLAYLALVVYELWLVSLMS